MRSKYFFKKHRKNIKEKKTASNHLSYNIPISTSVYNTTILHKHEKIIKRRGGEIKDKVSNHLNKKQKKEQNDLHSFGPLELKKENTHLETKYAEAEGICLENSAKLFVKFKGGEIVRSSVEETTVRDITTFKEKERRNTPEEGVKIPKDPNTVKINKKDLQHKFQKIISAKLRFDDLMKKTKLTNKELCQHIRCTLCNGLTSVSKGKYGYFFTCKECNKRVSRGNIDKFLFNERDKKIFKNKKRICFEIENKDSYRIHFFGNIKYGSIFNKIISEIIKEVITDLRKIKRNKIKYRNIIKYIYKMNNNFDLNNSYFNQFIFSPYRKRENIYRLGTSHSCNFYNYSFNTVSYASLLRKYNYIKRKKPNEYMLFLYNTKFKDFIESKKKYSMKLYKNAIKRYVGAYLKNDFFDEVQYLPLTWKPRKDYIDSGIFPFHLSRDNKKRETFKRMNVNNNNYLSGCVFNLCSYQLLLHYFIYKLFHYCYIYEIPHTVFYFFRHAYKKCSNMYSINCSNKCNNYSCNKRSMHNFFLKNKYIDVIAQTYGKYRFQLNEITRKQNALHRREKHLRVTDIEDKNLLRTKEEDQLHEEEKVITNLYNAEELYNNSYIFNRAELKIEILKHYYAKKKRKIKKNISKEIKKICLEQIKKKLPIRIQNVIAPYQLETIYFFKKKNGRILIADEMGLGKTLQSIAIFYFFNLYPTLIVAPSSLKINWLSEIEKFINFFDTSKILVISSSNDFPKLIENYKVVIVSFNIFKKLYNLLRTIKFKLLIVDESHYIRTVHYGKQSQFAKMMKRKIKSTSKVIFLSGTPSINRPINIFHQIKYLINNNKIFCKNKYVFGEEFCKKYFYRGEKIYEENLRSWEFNLFLKKTVIIRRNISNIFKNNFPHLKRFFIYLPNDIWEKSIKDYRNDNQSFIVYNKITDKEYDPKKEKNDEQFENGEISQHYKNDILMGKRNRQVLNEMFRVDIKSKKEEEGLSKVVNAVEYIEKLFPGKKKIIFCYHLVVCKCIEEEVLKIIKKKKEKEKINIDYVVLNGCLTEKEKLEKISYFQNNDNCYYGIFTICSVSHGLDFSFCNLCFFVELPVNFFHLQQCESRLFRKNQKLNTYIFYFLLKNGLGSDHKTWKRFTLCSHSTRSIIDGTNFSSKDLFYENFSNDMLPIINENRGVGTNRDELNLVRKYTSCNAPNVDGDNGDGNDNNDYKRSMRNSKESKTFQAENECEIVKVEISSDDETAKCEDYNKKNKKKRRYLFEINTLTNRIHTYNKNKKTNFPIEDLNNFKDNEKNGKSVKKYAKEFLQNYNKLNMNEKKLIEKKKCDINISLLKYLRANQNINKCLKFQRYIKNTTSKDNIYVKAYLENSFKGKFQVFYYQEYDEETNSLKCLYCKNYLHFTKNGILEENDILHYLNENSNTEIVEKFKNELNSIKLKKNSNIKKIIICNENDLFCAGNCRKLYFLKKSSCSIRRLIYERDKGVCNICRLDCQNLIKQIKNKKYFSVKEKIDYFIKMYPLFIENIEHLKNILQKPTDGYIWHVDHILPVFKGGGEASFDNLQTLCTFCHKKKTKDDVKNRRKRE
ncbi:DNA helicase [Plasmodium brasilianum]|uniref:DNA helicase, putative n=2 Tax=Plasmodium (Plasmodium) TaxID=418103 RepID=A0A1A8W8G9_PLAMA|nr:DNA helicase, putative [Plasmodium malariae]KAI4837445.1 DNA helicase [Plasmodium brasilianum]SBS87483.1 DNA helicase, putative [Plasmodium malariae]SCO93329.1 DNA helicase, putative [Plasmodium malariae]